MSKFTKTLAAFILIFAQLVPFAGYAETPKDPVIHLAFEDNFENSIANSYSGSKSGKVSFTEGIMGKGVQLSGGYIDLLGTNDFNYSKGMSLSVWVKMNTDNDFTNHAILYKAGPEDGDIALDFNFGYVLQLFQSEFGFKGNLGNEYFEFPSDPNKYKIDPSQLVEKWAHIATTFDGKEQKFYLDSELLHSEYVPEEVLKVINNYMKSSTPLRIGKGYEYSFDGYMDEFKLFDYALSEDDVIALHNEASGQYSGQIELRIDDPNIYVNGVGAQIDPSNFNIVPTIIDGRTLVPIRAIMDGIDGEINWDASERRIDLKYKETTISLWLDNKTAKVNGQDIALDVPPMTIEDRTMLPLRFVGEKLGMKVEWIDTTQTIILRY